MNQRPRVTIIRGQKKIGGVQPMLMLSQSRPTAIKKIPNRSLRLRLSPSSAMHPDGGENPCDSVERGEASRRSVARPCAEGSSELTGDGGLQQGCLLLIIMLSSSSVEVTSGYYEFSKYLAKFFRGSITLFRRDIPVNPSTWSVVG